MYNFDKSLEAIEKLRRSDVLVHCVTNTVAQYFTANVLLACHAVPTMTSSRDEAPAITARADSLLVNLGTLDPERRRVIERCTKAAIRGGKPVVLDPVKCQMSPVRLRFSQKLLGPGNLFLKANEAEARALSSSPALLRVVTGRIDRIEYGSAVRSVENGTPMLGRTIATGCALGALLAALAVVADSPDEAALAALVWFGVAAELADEKSAGPGSFPGHFIDALANVDTGVLQSRARIR